MSQPTPTRTLKRWMSVNSSMEREEEISAINSVTLAINARGQVQPEVKVYHADIAEAERLALESLRRIQLALIDTPIPGLKGTAPEIPQPVFRKA